MARPGLSDEIAALSVLCRDLGLGTVAPVPLATAHHSLFRVGPHPIVARVQSAEAVAIACRRAEREVAVARHLARRGAPALAPLDRLAGPHVAGGSVTTLWPNVASHRVAGEEDAALAAETLAAVHAAMRDHGGGLPPFTEALDRCWAVLAGDGALSGLAADDRALLRTHYRRLRHRARRRGSTGTRSTATRIPAIC